MKSLPSLCVASVLCLAAGVASADGVILLYHRFGEERYPTTNVRLAEFEAQLDYLESAGYQIWPLERMVEMLREGKAPPDRTVAITVDDAFTSVYTEAWPRLRERRWPFTVFVSTDPVDQRREDYMSWAQMREMAATGVRFFNHSRSHDYLVRDWHGKAGARAVWREEILGAQARLEVELGVRERLFAYPYGEYDAELAALVRELGFIGFGQQSGAIGRLSDLRSLPRFPAAGVYANLDTLRVKLSSRALPVIDQEPFEPVTGSRRPLLRLVLEESDANLGQLVCYLPGQGVVTPRRVARLTFEVEAEAPLMAGRSRYNCTAPAADGRWYWYSHQWLIRPD